MVRNDIEIFQLWLNIDFRSIDVPMSISVLNTLTPIFLYIPKALTTRFAALISIQVAVENTLILSS